MLDDVKRMMTRRRCFRLLFCGGSLTLAAAGRTAHVISHRGEHLRNPENSLEGIQAAIEIGVDFVELDVRTTLDGKFVLMHDASVDRTTDGKGAVAGMHSEQLRNLKVPMFEDALEILRRSASTGLYLDAKQIDAPSIARLLREHRMDDRTVVYGGVQLLRELQQTGSRARVMPEARNPEVLRSLLTDLKPQVVAFDHRDWNQELIAMAKSGGVKDLFVDRLGPNDTQAAWEAAIQMGATGIQTDHPADLIAFLARNRKKHEKA